MAARPSITNELEHPPAVSGTPTAWLTLLLFGILVTGWLFLNPLTCVLIRAGVAVTAFWTGDRVHIGEVTLTRDGWVQLKDLDWSRGTPAHPSTFRAEWLSLRPAPLLSFLFPKAGAARRPVREFLMGRSRVLVDLRGDAGAPAASSSSGLLDGHGAFPPLPLSLGIGPMDLVVIGESSRVSVTGLTARLPERWPGRLAYTGASIDAGTWHRGFPGASAPAVWEAGALQAGALDLGGGIRLRDFSLSAADDRLELGFRGQIGRGMLRGDGGLGRDLRRLELTMVGESLSLEALSDLFPLGRRATGEIAQARFTFRGDPARPLESDSSLRLVARNFRWDGRGWESLRLSALLTGRNLTLGELSLRQGHNEVMAEGRSRVPTDWRLILRAPFAAEFHASLEDAGALASLAGPVAVLPPLSGSVELQGAVRGADNRAEGSCELTGARVKVRDLPLDWIRASLAFEGDHTRLISLEARSGADFVRAEGEAAHARPHAYRAKATASVGDITRRLSQLGIAANPLLGGGAVHGTWEGSGELSTAEQSGSFHADVSEWVSRWTRSGMSGSFEGSYAPGRMELSKADFTQNDLRLSLHMSAAPDRLTLSELTAIRRGTADPLVSGSLSLPVDLGNLLTGGDRRTAVSPAAPLQADLALRGIRAEELTQLLGQSDLVRGSLEGGIRASGTLAAPDLHARLRIAGFAASPGAPASDLTIEADSAAGRLAVKAADQRAGETRFAADLDLPLQTFSGPGRLMLAGPEGRIAGRTVFHGFPVDGWAALMGRSQWPLRGSRVDGVCTFGGTMAAPDLAGGLTLQADGADLPGSVHLDDLRLPLMLTPGQVVMTNGAARFHGQPVAISVDLHRVAQGMDGRVGITGTSLDLPLGVPELLAKGDADIALPVRGGAVEGVVGAGTITSLSVQGHVVLRPALLPSSISRPLLRENAPGGIMPLNLTLRTDSAVDGGAGEKLAVDLKVTGTPEDPKCEGRIAIANARILSPQGPLFLPTARLDLGKEGCRLSPATAFGVGPEGMRSLLLSGPVDDLSVMVSGQSGTIPLTAFADSALAPPKRGRLALRTPALSTPDRWTLALTPEVVK